MKLDDVKKKLHDRRLSIVSEKTGVHQNTLRAIRDGKNANPTMNTLRAIVNYLERDND